MPLLDCIHAARERLRDGSIRSEQAVSQSVVLPILDALGWPRSDPRFVVPEYSVGSGRVDFALLTHGRATVFVEVKQPGLAGRADDQLFRYAYHEGIQIAVLTDGKTWHVYGPGLRGTINERKVAMVDLLNDDPAECVSRFERYLDRAAVDGEAAEENVRADYRRLRERRIARETFGKAWANLVAETRLADLLAAEVERACGFQPEATDVTAFLTTLRPSTAALPAPRRTPVPDRDARPTDAPEVREPRLEPPAPLRIEIPWSAGSWIGQGVTLPAGTELRASVKGQHFSAVVRGGLIVFGNRGYKTPSAAGRAANGYETNGWKTWEVRRPGDTGWVLLDALRS